MQLRLLLLQLTCMCLCAPIGASPPDPSQQQIAEAFAEKCTGSRIIYDDDGNVIKLALSRHTGRKDDDPLSLPPGVTDAEFRNILQLPKLEAVFLEKLPLSDDSYALLGQLRNLKDVRIHYPAWAKTQTRDGSSIHITNRFGSFINEFSDLRVLQFKHIFRLPGDGFEGLRPQSELEHLEIDTICAQSSAVPFIAAATKLKNLQVHRCEWTDVELQTVLAALPDLEVLELKPNTVASDPITGRSLRGLALCPKLQLVQLTGQIPDLAFENGLDVLLRLPALKQVNLIFKDVTLQSIPVQRLYNARPGLLIRIGNEILGGLPHQRPRGIDDGYDWGGEITTHG